MSPIYHVVFIVPFRKSVRRPGFFRLKYAESSYIALLLIGGDGPIGPFFPMIDSTPIVRSLPFRETTALSRANISSPFQLNTTDCNTSKTSSSGRNGRSPSPIPSHVPFPQQDFPRHPSFSLHHHSPCLSGWRDHVQSSGSRPTLSSNGQSHGYPECKDRPLRPRWSLWRSSSVWGKSENPYVEGSAGCCSARCCQA